MKKQHNREDQDIVKEEKKDKLISRLSKLTWEEDYNLVYDFCHSDIKLELNDIKKMLLIDDKSLVDVFLSEYILFDDEDKAYLIEYINDNLSHESTEFLSDLVYIANDLSLNIDYVKVLGLIIKYVGDENYVVLGALHYISNNIKYRYIEEIFEALEEVVNSTNYYQVEQILASITLYRVTNKVTYLDFVKELLLYDKDNAVFIVNLLKEEPYQEKYFNVKTFVKRVNLPTDIT